MLKRGNVERFKEFKGIKGLKGLKSALAHHLIGTLAYYRISTFVNCPHN